ncbi:hypothetical protein MFIFM68171_06412 [Madurella fahalii]|uniref:Uncharacterized protein n=1 Tax=Madurella fahalii TaxID=1157608 RepID=A0ABQ0GEL4_9PEZI
MAVRKGDSGVAYTVTVFRDDTKPRHPSVHPLFRSRESGNEFEQVQDPCNKPKHSRRPGSPEVKRETADADANIVMGKPQGVVILRATDTEMETASTAGRPVQDDSNPSGRPTTAQGVRPDLGSLRRGPRLRHSRLPPSPSSAATRPWDLPKSTRELWGIVGRLRGLMIASALLLELSILSFVSSITVVAMMRREHGYPGTGVVAWAALSGILVVVLPVSFWLSILQYRKTTKRLLSGENWIEMHRRSRPLPPRPISDGEQQQDNSTTEEAWQKFAQDHEQLRRYVEFLENRIGVLEEGQQGAHPTIDPGDGVAAGNSNDHEKDNGIANSNPKPKPLKVDRSLSRRKLIQPEAEPGPNGATAIPVSSTKTSILTELCEAVTEGYSPLSEQSGPIATQTPNSHNHTPRSRLRGSNNSGNNNSNNNTPLGHLAPHGKTAVHHQRGVHSVDIFGGKVGDM